MRSRSGAICRARGCSGICPAPPPRLGYGWRKRGHHGNQSHSDCKPAHAYTHFDAPTLADWYKPITPFSTACRPAGCDGRHRSVDLNLGGGSDSNLRSVLKPVVDVLDHFILKFDQTVCTAPPLIDFVLRRLDSLHHDAYAHWT